MTKLRQLELIRQPSGSSLCGQCVVAMLSGRTLDEVTAAMGSGRNYPATLRKQASSLGVNLAKKSVPTVDGRGPTGVAGAGFLMSLAESGVKMTHWVVWDGDKWLDPAFGEYAKIPDNATCGVYSEVPA